MKKTIILLCLIISTITQVLAQTRIGVYTYGVLPENYNTLLGDNLVEAFTESNQYIAVNRSASLFNMLQKARSIQEKGHIDQSQVLSTSKEYGETQICAVDVIEIDYMYIFRATLLDATTNEVIKTASAEVAKSEIGYTKILEIAQKLSGRLISTTLQTSSDLKSLKATSDVALARKRVEENRQYDISYAEFKNECSQTSSYSNNKYLSVCPSARYYMDVNWGLNFGGGMLLGFLGTGGILGAGLGYGLYLEEHDLKPDERKSKITAMLCIMGASVLPGIVLLSAAPACKKKAWKECRKPYDDAVKDLERARKYQSQASLEIAPAVGYDWAGINLKLTF